MTLSGDVLRDLPTGANLFSLLETTQAEVVVDRFNSGGLNVGQSSRVGAFLASWSQTQYRIGDVNVTSPRDGAPLFFPEIVFWDRVGVTTGLMPPDINAPGLGVSLEPRQPSAVWTRIIDGSIAGRGFTGSGPSSGPPAISRLDDWRYGSVLVSGPVTPRVGVVAGGTWARNTTIERSTGARRATAGSLFAHVLFTPSPGRELRTLAWVQRVEAATADRSLHLQSTLQNEPRAASSWRIFGSYTRRRRVHDGPAAETRIVDRLVDGPIPALIDDADSTDRRWSLGLRASPSLRSIRHTLQLGAEIERTSSRARPPFARLIGERVDGLPARVWAFANPGRHSNRQATTVAAFASSRFAPSAKLIVDASLRFESMDGSAEGALTGIVWRTLLPGASLRWKLGTRYDLSVLTGVRRSANQLLLGLLAYGDPAAPVASVFRWDGELAATGTLVARVGPGTGGDSAFSGIDANLKRPLTDEFAIGLESRPRSTLRLRAIGVARRQSSLVNVVNSGVPASSYSTFSIPDANVDLVGTADDQELVVYDRLPASFGKDRYLLTNPGQDAATLGAVVITAEAATPRLFLLIGATASAALGSGGNRGFRAVENDQDMPGELFTNPNASTFARGRLFSDRAYTIKWTTVYRFPGDFRVGAVARYQDGQPFSRIVVVPGLNQGLEAIQAFANGRSRFAFTGTLDVRLQKGFALGRTRLDGILDAYNLFNMTKEAEEYVVTGERFRQTTAVQPPRTFHLGMRVSF